MTRDSRSDKCKAHFAVSLEATLARKTYYANPDAGRQAGDTKQLAFAKNLNRELLRRGWNQSDLVRATEAKEGKGNGLGRDTISKYVNGLSFPTPRSLALLVDALGLEEKDLFPNAAMQAINDEHPEFDHAFDPVE